MPSWLAAPILFPEAESYYQFLLKKALCSRDPRQQLAADCMYQKTQKGFSLIFELHFKLGNKNYKLEHNFVKSPTYDVVSGVHGWFMPFIRKTSVPFKTVVSFFYLHVMNVQLELCILLCSLFQCSF